MRWIEHSLTEPALNLAIEEVLLREATEETFVVWQNAPAVIVGRNQNTLAEVDTAWASAHGIAVVRRLSGGGAVYHDLGNINYTHIIPGVSVHGVFASFPNFRHPRVLGGGLDNTLQADAITTFAQANPTALALDSRLRGNDGHGTYCEQLQLGVGSTNSWSFAEFTAPLVRALRRLGVPAEFSGRNDLTVSGRKFSGTARTTRDGNTLFHGTLLFRTDLDTLERVLTPAAEKLVPKGVASVRSRVTNLAEWLPPETTAADIITALRSEFGATIAVSPLTATELAAAELLAEIKYRQWAWNVGAAPACQVTRSRRFSSGGVTVSFTAEHGKIAALVVSGDFFGTREVAELSAHLVGTPLHRDALTERLATATFLLTDAIEGVTVDDFISLLL